MRGVTRERERSTLDHSLFSYEGWLLNIIGRGNDQKGQHRGGGGGGGGGVVGWIGVNHTSICTCFPCAYIT